jgi:hypothetical protein
MTARPGVWVFIALILRSWVRILLKAWLFALVLPCRVVLLVYFEGEECICVYFQECREQKK